MLHCLEILATLSPSPLPDTPDILRPLLGAFVDLVPGARPVGNHGDFDTAAQLAAFEVLKYVACHCADVENKLKRLPSFYGRLPELSEYFRLRIVSLNYDDLPLQANIALDTGHDPAEAGWRFRPGRLFDPANVSHLLMQLHGSVRLAHRWKPRQGGYSIAWHSTREEAAEEWRIQEPLSHAQDGSYVTSLPIVTGLRKADKVALVDPFSTYHAAFTAVAHRAAAWLVVGYGNGDAHVNQVLRSAMEARTTTDDAPRILVVDYPPIIGKSEAWHEVADRVFGARRGAGQWSISVQLCHPSVPSPNSVAPADFLRLSPHVTATFGGTDVAFGSGWQSALRILRTGSEF